MSNQTAAPTPPQTTEAPRAVSTVAVPASAPERARPATRTLAWLQFLSVVLVTIFTVASIVGITTARDGAIRGSESLTRYVSLQQLQSYLHSSMSMAVTQQLTGGKTPDAVLSPLSTASQLVVEAGRIGAPDQRLLQLQDALTTYAYRLGSLTTGNAQGPGSLSGATAELEKSNELASRIVDSSRERLDEMAVSQGWWAIPLTVVCGLLLVWVLWVLAKRSHRVINLGVLLALVFVVGSGTTSYLLMDASSTALRATRAGELEQTRLLADARTALNQAKDAEGRSLLAGDASHERQWGESLKRAEAALQQASAVSASERRIAPISLESYEAAHTTLRQSVGAGRIQSAIDSSTTGPAAQAFAEADNSIRLAMESSQNAARVRAGSPTDDLFVAVMAIGAFGIAAAGFAWWGVGARMREFR